jgi:hypothetical protein
MRMHTEIHVDIHVRWLLKLYHLNEKRYALRIFHKVLQYKIL